ncbi:hypothetical protein [Persicobacter psychrovividus]|uniref:HEPN domain-containing protein n=1 Tax=Persicobacter psychrovividus TaxID=387638 RepID=A0ABN6LH05_9BACT|nr:hypothetical protein PEPS_46420 [Persicobacter psychrovividus]
MIRIKHILFFVILFFLGGCSAATSVPADNIKITFDFLTLARSFLDASIVLFHNSNNRQGLARLYYVFYTLHMVSYFDKKKETKPSGENKHKNIWKGSVGSKKLRKAFGESGFLKTRHQCDYYSEDNSSTTELMKNWLSEDSTAIPDGIDVLNDNITKVIDKYKDQISSCSHCIEDDSECFCEDKLKRCERLQKDIFQDYENLVQDEKRKLESNATIS